MPRIGEKLVYATDDLLPHLSDGAGDTITKLCSLLNQFDPPGYATIPNLLNDDALRELEGICVADNQWYPTAELLEHPIAGPLAQNMLNISESNMDMRCPTMGTKISLKNETGSGMLVKPHRDLLDGHAVLFNFLVSGALFYVLDGVVRPVRQHELVVLNGAAMWGNVTDYLPAKEGTVHPDAWQSLGGVTVAHSVVGIGHTSRNRLLAYCDGRETGLTQIPAQLPPWF